MKRSPLSRTSSKRARQQRKYRELREGWLDGRMCERCGKPATDVHHKAGRIGERLIDTSLWAALCRRCHMWVEENPKAAREAGLSESRYQ